MYFKRPSFRRGGSTGIGQLTPRVKAKMGFPGFEFLEAGIQNELRSQMKPPSGQGLTRGTRGARLLTQLRNLGIPKASTAGLMSIPFALPAGIAYMNRPKTLAEKKVMQEYGPIDETFFQYDEYDADRKAASKIGDKISFKEALFKDPETGLYPKIFGSTESRNKKAEIEKDKQEIEDSINMDMRGDPAQFSGEDELTDFDAIAERIIPDKKTDTDDDTPKEPSFEDTYEAEKKKIEKLIGEDDNKGLLAIALSDAIGTPGTIADKAAVLNKSLLSIMAGKKKDKKDIAKLAYTATKEIEKAKLAAGKEGFSEKQFNKLSRLQRIVNDKTGSYSDAEKTAAQAEINVTKEIINTIGGKKDKTGLTPSDLKILGDINLLVKEIKRHEGKNDEKYKAALAKFARAKAALKDMSQFDSSIAIAEAEISGTLFKKDGGRIKKQLGGGTETTAMEVSETVGQGETPTAQVQQLSFSELRNRLPKEITDDVIRLLSNSNEALQDFAYIRTQGDVSKFNTKYGVTLVLPAQTA